MYKDNLNKIKYTINHKKVVISLYKQLTGHIPFRAIFHDVDKIFLLAIGFNPKKASKIHRSFAKHHDTSQSNFNILVEMAIDWESARFSKPDKPLNARQTLYSYYKDMIPKMSGVLTWLGL